MIILPEDKKIIARLPPDEVKALMLALLTEDVDTSELSMAVMIAYDIIKDRNERMSRRQSGNGSKGGRPKKPVKPENPTEDEKPKKATESQKSQLNPENPLEPKKASGTVTDTESVTDSNSPTPLAGEAPDGAVVCEANDITKVQKRRELEKRQIDLFSQFWAQYPHKKHKPDAQKAWMALKVTDQLFAEIMVGLERWLSCDQWQRGMIENPANFLRNRQWEDDPPIGINSSVRGQLTGKPQFVVGSISPQGTEEQRKAMFERLIE